MQTNWEIAAREGENMRQGIRFGMMLLLALALVSPARSQECDHHWQDAAGERTRWLVTENAHQKVREQEMTCALCGATAYRQTALLEPGRSHTWTLLHDWHEAEKGLHMYQQVCAACGGTSTAQVSCEGEPCHAAVTAPVDWVETPCAEMEDHCWKDVDSYRETTLSGKDSCWERKMVCLLCGAASYRQP